MNITSEIFNQDCIAGMEEHVPDNIVHCTVTSIPFEELFTYSGKLEDVGNNGSTVDIVAGRFALNMMFVIAQLYRVTVPGGNVCIHIQQLLAYKNQHGFSGRRDFRGAMIQAFTRGGEIAVPDTEDGQALPLVRPSLDGGGFRFIGEFVIPKDPQAMAQRLNLHSLQFKTGYARNSANLAPAVNDYVLIFQKPGEHPDPPRAIYHAQKNPNGWITTEDWIKWASGVWHDIDEFDIIDGARSARESDEEKHVCPLQLEVIRRLVKLYTKPGHLVLDPFMGVGSTAAIAVELDRHSLGFELKESYHANALKNVQRARDARAVVSENSRTLFEAVA